MNLELSPEALEYGRTAREALAAAGPGDTERTLDRLGAWELMPGEPEAAAALCRAAGYSAAGEDGTDYPVAERLAPGEDATGLTLACWTLLGMLDKALDLTREHVTVREQFGQPLAKFQGVQFQLTEAEVQRAGLEVLAAYTLWSGTYPDALALRLAALEAADVVFRVAHQLHGALGFCDEAPLSWLSRRSQPLRRRPWGLSATRARLAAETGRAGLAGLYDLEYRR